MAFLNIPIKIKNELEQRMADMFLMYDFIGNSMIENKFVPNVLRFLGCVPTEKDILEFIKACQVYDITDATHLMPFMSFLTSWLLEGRMKPATLDELIDAFTQIDIQRKGFISKAEFIEHLIKYGESIKDDELSTLLSISCDITNNVCHCDGYIYKLYLNAEHCIYKKAAELDALLPKEPQ